MFEKPNHSCKICNKSEPDVEFYFRTNKCGNKYPSTYCKPCEREKSRTLKKKKWNDPLLGKNLRDLAKTRMSTPEYKEARALAFRTKYANDPDFRDCVKNAVTEYNNSESGLVAKKVRAAIYYQQNKEQIVAKLRKAQEENPKLRIRSFMRSRINETLRSQGSSKAGASSFLYLPYKKNDLFAHLESMFDPWMNFNNYGSGTEPNTKWHIDHVIPQAYFPYASMDSQLFRWCWDLKNLRPLCSVQNTGDGDREDLFGSVRDIRIILDELRDIGSFQNLRESASGVYDSLSKIRKVQSVCPMNMYGLNYLDSIFTHRFSASTHGFSSLVEALKNDDRILDSIRYLITKGMIINKANLYSVMRYSNRTPGHFFPAAAASVIKKYANNMSHVHDPFLGWGGRALAAISSGVARFTGTDLQPDTISGCQVMASDFKLLSKTDCSFFLSDALSHLTHTKDRYDLIFTSPPFLDTENYNIQSDSMNQKWIDNFIIPICHQFNKTTKSDGVVALHLKDLKGAPTFTAYHIAMLNAGFKQVDQHKYGRTWVQSIYIYAKT